LNCGSLRVAKGFAGGACLALMLIFSCVASHALFFIVSTLLIISLELAKSSLELEKPKKKDEMEGKKEHYLTLLCRTSLAHLNCYDIRYHCYLSHIDSFYQIIKPNASFSSGEAEAAGVGKF